jgi:hypothetical protein
VLRGGQRSVPLEPARYLNPSTHSAGSGRASLGAGSCAPSGNKEALCLVPESISRTLTDYTKDPERIFERWREINDVLEQLCGAATGD